MPFLKTKTSKSFLNETQLVDVKHHAIYVLKSLVKPYGIYASGAGDWDGGYHHFFGRDSAITAMMILEAEKVTGEYVLSQKALQGLLVIAKFQGKQDNNFTGEEVGKIPHEINTDRAHVKSFQRKILESGENPWYVDPSDGFLKNWDSADGTSLWVLAVCKFLEDGWKLPAGAVDSLAKATEWIISNIERFDGFVGWIPADEQPHRKYGGLQNQSWKDSSSPYINRDGSLAKYPMHDIFSQSTAWAALKYAAIVLKKSNPPLSKEAAKTAKRLKKNFNKTRGGFRNPKNFYFADALDADLKQLKTPSIDAGMCLGADCNGEVVIGRLYIHQVVNRLISREFTDDRHGIRTYSKYIKNYRAKDQYHRGPETYWPFAGFLTALGLEKQGYKIASEKIIKATFAGLSNFESFVELFVKSGDQVGLWQSSKTKQVSMTTQAWTAAGAYYGASYLLNKRRAIIPIDIPIARQVKNLLPTPIFISTH